MSPSKPQIRVYIDGFNLYFRRLKNGEFKWLDLLKMSQAVLSEYQVEHIKYFTSRVIDQEHDLHKALRQSTYIRALHTRNIEVIEGKYLIATKRGKITRHLNGSSNSISLKGEFVEIETYEEKGSDVNIASHLLMDAYEDKFDTAAIISNDSDLKTPIEIVSRKLGKYVIVVCPQKNLDEMSFSLKQQADEVRPIFVRAIRDSQFPQHLTDSTGRTIHKPPKW